MTLSRRLACILAFATVLFAAACAGPARISERERTSLATDTYVTDAQQDSELAKDAAPARNAKLAAILVRVAGVAANSGDHATAARLYRRAHILDPDRSDVALALGRSLLATHDYAGAAEAFQAVLAHESSNEEALRGKGVALFALGRYDEALPALEAAAAGRSDPRVLRDLAISYDLSGNSKDAQTAYRQALERNPDDPTLRAHLALSYALSGQGDKVAPLLDPVAGRPALSSHDRRVMAAAYELSGDTHKARQLLRQDYDAADTDRAFADFDRARTLAPHNPGVAYALIFDRDRSADEARAELARITQSPERADVAENSTSRRGSRRTEPTAGGTAPGQSVDFNMADELSGRTGADNEPLPIAGAPPLQVAEAADGPAGGGRSRSRQRVLASQQVMARGYHAQLGAYRTEPRAEKGWKQLRAAAPEALGGVDHIVVADPRPNGQPTLYQLRTTAFAERRQAADLCEQLKARALDCFVLASRGAPPGGSETPMVERGTTSEPGADAPAEGRAWPAAASVVAGGQDVQFQVQLAAYHTLERAERGWQLLNRSAPSVLGQLTHVVITPTQLPEASPLFRLRTREFVERPPADTVCGDLRAQNLDCLVVATTLRTGSDLVAQAPARAPRKAVAKKVSKKKTEVAVTDTGTPLPEKTPEPPPAPDVATSSATPEVAPDVAAEPVVSDTAGHESSRTGYSVQLAAYKSARLAEDGWKRYRNAAPDLLGQLQPVIARPDGTAQNRMFRLRAATFEERAVADALCFELKARKLDCLVVQTRMSGSDVAANDDTGAAPTPGDAPVPSGDQPAGSGPDAPIEIQIPPRP